MCVCVRACVRACVCVCVCVWGVLFVRLGMMGGAELSLNNCSSELRTALFRELIGPVRNYHLPAVNHQPNIRRAPTVVEGFKPCLYK